MSRGALKINELKNIVKTLPDLTNLKNNILGLHPDTVSTSYSPDSTIPIAIVCLKDAFRAFEEANYAIRESYAHKIWYRKNGSSNITSLFFEKYYVDDVGLRIYSTAEHLAYAIRYMLRISDKSLKRSNKSSSSLAKKIGIYLYKNRPKHTLTNSIKALLNNTNYTIAINYRNDWVHNKPPIILGRGMQWDRKKRWEEIREKNKVIGYRLNVGGSGDEAKYTIEQIRAIMKDALFALVKLAEDISIYYLKVLKKRIYITNN